MGPPTPLHGVLWLDCLICCDSQDHLQECISRFVVMSSHAYNSTDPGKVIGLERTLEVTKSESTCIPRCKWLNPNEDMLGINQVLHSINNAVVKLREDEGSSNDNRPQMEVDNLVEIEDMVQAISHPRVVSLVAKMLYENCRSRK